MKNILTYQPGTVLVFTSGCYSDFGTSGFLVTIKDCDLKKIVSELRLWKKKPENQRYKGDDDAEPSDLASFMIVSGYAMPLDCQTVHLGDYSEFESEFSE